MKIPVSLNESMILSSGGVVYDGPTSLVQYTVESTRMVSKSPKYLVVEITLKRMFQYHLAATFLPTILLMIITEITLFVDEKHFEVTLNSCNRTLMLGIQFIFITMITSFLFLFWSNASQSLVTVKNSK